ncbi:MAG: hypothetical protein LBR39_03675 [Coriobacteriales bacterium]|jgi:hypothetical protein|nr:hypothetical protein [Coriobacteriales bacterium]
MVKDADIEETMELTDEKITDRVVFYAFDQAAEMLQEAGGFEPFTIILKGEDLFIEEHPGESVEECYDLARKEVFKMQLIAEAYAFCYDGFVELEDGPSDAIIVERASKGDAQAEVLVVLYHQHGDHYHFDETFYSMGETEPLFIAEVGEKPEADADAAADAEATAAADSASDAQKD